MPLVRFHALGREREIGDGRPVLIIAEIGKNFIQTEEERPVAEYLGNAITLVRAAKEAGADAVKFQTHTVEDEQLPVDVIAPHFKGADRYRWVARNTRITPLEEFWKPLKQVCDELGIIFFSTPMSRGAARKIAPLDPALWKVGSGDILDFVCLDELRRSNKPIILSSGMSTIEEVDAVIAFLKEKTNQIVLLHCVSRYPCPPEDLHLRTISFYRERYGLPIGFSDHSIGIESAIATVALGACVVEKHFSFDRSLWGSDHKVSLTPTEFAALVDGIRLVEADFAYRGQILASEIVQRGMGTEAKVLQEDEAVFRPIFRKTLIAARGLPAGAAIGSEDIYAMRPQAYAPGLPSERYPQVLGRRAARAISRYEPIVADSLTD